MLHDGLCLVSLDSLWHHVHNVLHDCCSKLKIVVRLGSLFCYYFDKPFGMSALKLSSQQIPEPSLKKWYNAPQEKQPHSPSRRPYTHTWPLTHRPSIETIVNNMLHILAHTDLPHYTILVPINTGELSQVRIHVLETIVELECIDVTQAVLHVAVDDELDNTEDFTAEVEGITETGFLALFGSQCLDWFKIEVVIQVQVVEVLSMN